ncbi:nucleotidyltransferase family protein [Streptomyces niger]|uniref:nucleotidyltransferase family protein n=1 Tax=Streptomyces niger TaxID=66373 RepID=UPI000DA62E98|nr:sugar phosphate nucleotidyltransferase [Streptomyces niger]
MKAVVIAGGEGRRLGQATAITPKPLMEFEGTPLLHIILRQLRSAGFSEVTLSLRHRADLIKASCAAVNWGSLELDFIVESQRMGTAGPLKLLPPLQEATLVMNADLLTSLDFTDVMSHHSRSGADSTIVITPHDTELAHGVVRIDDNSRVVSFEEKPRIHHLINCGIYVVEPTVLDCLPGQTPCDMPVLLENLRTAGGVVGGYIFEGEWRDIGTPQQLEEARIAFRENHDTFLPESELVQG